MSAAAAAAAAVGLISGAAVISVCAPNAPAVAAAPCEQVRTTGRVAAQAGSGGGQSLAGVPRYDGRGDPAAPALSWALARLSFLGALGGP